MKAAHSRSHSVRSSADPDLLSRQCVRLLVLAPARINRRDWLNLPVESRGLIRVGGLMGLLSVYVLQRTHKHTHKHTHNSINNSFFLKFLTCKNRQFRPTASSNEYPVVREKEGLI